jgi:hypothetical protein
LPSRSSPPIQSPVGTDFSSAVVSIPSSFTPLETRSH